MEQTNDIDFEDVLNDVEVAAMSEEKSSECEDDTPMVNPEEHQPKDVIELYMND